jgi:putative phosphoribosyl transferase
MPGIGRRQPLIEAVTYWFHLVIYATRVYGVIELNELAFARLQGEKAIEIVPGATHLFPESGAMEAVIGHAARWFDRYFSTGHSGGGARRIASR